MRSLVPLLKRPAQAKNRHTHPAGHQHVVVDVLPAHEKRQTAAQHPDSAVRQGRATPAARHLPHDHQHHERVQRGHPTQGPGVYPQYRHGCRLEPIQIRRLVEKGNAVQARRQPIARLQHPAANFPIAPFIGNGQGTHGGQHQQQGKAGQHGPAGATRRFGILGMHAASVVARCHTPASSVTRACCKSCAKSSLARYSYSQARAAPMGSLGSWPSAGWHMMTPPSWAAARSQACMRRA